MSIAALLEAAEYLERREREAEHGYASTLPMPDDLSSSNNSGHHHNNSGSNRRKPKNKKSQGNSRHTHNELEKNRRAHLRNCLEKLKDMVPLGPEASRHTTLGLLTRAKAFIKNLDDKDRKLSVQKEQLFREQRFLRRRIESLDNQLRFQQRRSVSECSTSTSSTSETDEVDIMGYNSNASDSDDHSSIQSMNSDGGVAISTRRLSLVEAF